MRQQQQGQPLYIVLVNECVLLWLGISETEEETGLRAALEKMQYGLLAECNNIIMRYEHRSASHSIVAAWEYAPANKRTARAWLTVASRL